MSVKYVHELFPEKIDPKISPENLIEVFDCYDSRYGNIFYKGEHIYNFYKEGYDEALQHYETVDELKDKGLDIKKAQVVVYELDPLRDYQDDMQTIDFELAADYSYEEMLKGFTDDLDNIKKAVIKEEKRAKWFKFIDVVNFKNL